MLKVERISSCIVFVILLVTGSNDCISLPVVHKAFVQQIHRAVYSSTLQLPNDLRNFTFNAPSINIPRIKVTRCESSVGVKNVNSRYERNIGLLKRKKKAKNLDRFNFKLVRIFQYDRYGLVCAVNSFHLFLDES